MFPIRDHNPSGRVPFVTYTLMALNIGIFLSYWPIMDDPRALMRFYLEWSLIPRQVTGGMDFAGLVTSMFLHGGLLHLAGNMLFLFIFGDNIEDAFGHFGFAVFYLACGVGAGLAHVISDPLSTVPTVGASGAIAAVMGGYLLLYPKARVDILLILVIIFKVIPVPAWIMLGLWFAFQLFNGITAPAGAGVAYWAHAGGFLIGMAATVPYWIKNGGPVFWRVRQMQPPYPEAQYTYARSNVPRVMRRR